MRIVIGVAFALFLGYIYWGTVFRGGSRWYWPLKWLGLFFVYTCIMTVVALCLVLLWRFLEWGSTVPALRWVLFVPEWAFLWGVKALAVVLCAYLVVALVEWLLHFRKHSK